MHRTSPRILVMAVAIVMLAGCASDDGGADTPADAEQAAGAPADSDAGSDDDVAASGGCPVQECADGLLPELEGIPVPPNVEAYGVGQTEEDRTDGIIGAQQLFLDGSVADAAAFY